LKILNTEFGTRNEELADSVKEYLSTLEKGVRILFIFICNFFELYFNQITF